MTTKRNCCIKDCSNSGYKLSKWKTGWCDLHECNLGTARCICPPPFTLFPFPTERKNPDGRAVWIRNVNRVAADGKSKWMPTENSRICSEHFVDNEPTQSNPYPTINLGYNTKSVIKKTRPPPLDRSIIVDTPSKKKKCDSTDTISNAETIEYSAVATTQQPVCDHDYVSSCVSCADKDKIINDLRQKVRKLENQIVQNTPKPKLHEVLKSDKACKFYTGIPTVAAFNALYKVIEPQIPKIRHWKGPKHVLKYKKFRRTGPKRGLSSKEEMVITLMKLRLGLLNQDLADRFNVSSTHISRVFTTWIKILSQFFGSLVFNPSKEVVRENLPPKFRNQKYSSVRHIIDCSEVFLEKPQNLEVQGKTWSDYKHHHTAKFLISITPSGFINYVSDVWGGRTSDKYITDNSDFLNIVEPYDTVMADRGFQIKEELTLKRAYLMVPPGRRGACQMSTDEVVKTKEIANRRIYVEQAIRRLKCFRILKFELPVTLSHHLDCIIKTVAGICNLYPPLPKYK